MSRRTAFVTGSTGFLGITLCQELARAGWDVVAFHRPTSDLTDLKKLASVRYAVGDITDAGSVLAGMPDRVDTVFHGAGSVGFLDSGLEEQQYQVNVVGTENVLGAARERSCRRVVHTSSVLTYDYFSGQRISEDSPPNDHSGFSYIHTKYLADVEVDRAVEKGLDAVILHPSAIFGAYDKATWSKMFKEINRGLRVPIALPGGASVCHMREVARTLLSASARGASGEHYVLGGPDHSFREIGDAIADLLDKPDPRFTPPPRLFRTLCHLDRLSARMFGKQSMTTRAEAEIMCHTVLCDSGKAERDLGYRPVDLLTMLRDCHQWMRSENML